MTMHDIFQNFAVTIMMLVQSGKTIHIDSAWRVQQHEGATVNISIAFSAFRIILTYFSFMYAMQGRCNDVACDACGSKSERRRRRTGCCHTMVTYRISMTCFYSHVWTVTMFTGNSSRCKDMHSEFTTTRRRCRLNSDRDVMQCRVRMPVYCYTMCLQ